MYRIIIFQDKLGITDAYDYHWTNMLLKAGLIGPEFKFIKVKAYNQFASGQILQKKGNRKTLGFTEDPAMQARLLRWMNDQIVLHKANAIVLMDPALLFTVNPDWNQSTCELLRGGVYEMKINGVQMPAIVMTPISAINRSVKPKDIAAVNNGFDSKEEWEEYYGKTLDNDGNEIDGDDDGDSSESDRVMEWYAPITIPFGKFCLQRDIEKLGRLLRVRAQGKLRVDEKRRLRDRIFNDLPRLRQRTICYTADACAESLRVAKTASLGAVDIETIPYKKPTGMSPEQARPEHCEIYAITVIAFSFLTEDGFMESFCFPLQKSKDIKSGPPEEIETILETVAALLLLPVRYTLQNGVYDAIWLLYYGFVIANYAYDTMSMFWSIWPDLPKRLDFIASILLDDYKYWKAGRKDDDFVNYMVYAMSDTESTLLSTIVLCRLLNTDVAARRNFFHAHLRSLSGLSMSFFGLAVDEEVMDELRIELEADAEKKVRELRWILSNDEFNHNSPQQRAYLVYKLLGARPRNQKGKPVGPGAKSSTGAMALKAIRNDHPLFRRVINPLLDAVTPGKQISNVVKMPRFPAGPTGSRFLTSYDGVGTTTTRYSSRACAFGHGSNGQNIRKKYRRFARADRHSFLMEIDFSAADDVYVGFESGEPKKIELIRSGRDTHATNALIFFSNWTYDAIVAGKKADDPRVVDPITGVRQITKKLVHGGHYLMAGATLLASAGREAIVAAALEEGHSDAGSWTQEMLVVYCELLDSKFRNHYPRFQREQAGAISWYYDLRREVVKTGGFLTWNNYFQRFLSDPRDDSTLRAVAATAGQAGTAGRVNMVMDELVHGYIPKRFRDAPNPHANAEPQRVSEVGNGITIRLQTHDSITFNVNYRHPKWQDGVRGIFESFSRPCVIRGEQFNVGWEADVGVYWAGKEGVKVKTLDDIEYYVEEISRQGYDKLLA